MSRLRLYIIVTLLCFVFLFLLYDFSQFNLVVFLLLILLCVFVPPWWDQTESESKQACSRHRTGQLSTATRRDSYVERSARGSHDFNQRVIGGNELPSEFDMFPPSRTINRFSGNAPSRSKICHLPTVTQIMQQIPCSLQFGQKRAMSAAGPLLSTSCSLQVKRALGLDPLLEPRYSSQKRHSIGTGVLPTSTLIGILPHVRLGKQNRPTLSEKTSSMFNRSTVKIAPPDTSRLSPRKRSLTFHEEAHEATSYQAKRRYQDNELLNSCISPSLTPEGLQEQSYLKQTARPRQSYLEHWNRDPSTINLPKSGYNWPPLPLSSNTQNTEEELHDWKRKLEKEEDDEKENSAMVTQMKFRRKADIGVMSEIPDDFLGQRSSEKMVMDEAVTDDSDLDKSENHTLVADLQCSDDSKFRTRGRTAPSVDIASRVMATSSSVGSLSAKSEEINIAESAVKKSTGISTAPTVSRFGSGLTAAIVSDRSSLDSVPITQLSMQEGAEGLSDKFPAVSAFCENKSCSSSDHTVSEMTKLSTVLGKDQLKDHEGFLSTYLSNRTPVSSGIIRTLLEAQDTSPAFTSRTILSTSETSRVTTAHSTDQSKNLAAPIFSSNITPTISDGSMLTHNLFGTAGTGPLSDIASSMFSSNTAHTTTTTNSYATTQDTNHVTQAASSPLNSVHPQNASMAVTSPATYAAKHLMSVVESASVSSCDTTAPLMKEHSAADWGNHSTLTTSSPLTSVHPQNTSIAVTSSTTYAAKHLTSPVESSSVGLCHAATPFLTRKLSATEEANQSTLTASSSYTSIPAQTSSMTNKLPTAQGPNRFMSVTESTPLCSVHAPTSILMTRFPSVQSPDQVTIMTPTSSSSSNNASTPSLTTRFSGTQEADQLTVTTASCFDSSSAPASFGMSKFSTFQGTSQMSKLAAQTYLSKSVPSSSLIHNLSETQHTSQREEIPSSLLQTRSYENCTGENSSTTLFQHVSEDLSHIELHTRDGLVTTGVHMSLYQESTILTGEDVFSTLPQQVDSTRYRTAEVGGDQPEIIVVESADVFLSSQREIKTHRGANMFPSSFDNLTEDTACRIASARDEPEIVDVEDADMLFSVSRRENVSQEGVSRFPKLSQQFESPVCSRVTDIAGDEPEIIDVEHASTSLSQRESATLKGTKTSSVLSYEVNTACRVPDIEDESETIDVEATDLLFSMSQRESTTHKHKETNKFSTSHQAKNTCIVADARDKSEMRTVEEGADLKPSLYQRKRKTTVCRSIFPTASSQVENTRQTYLRYAEARAGDAPETMSNVEVIPVSMEKPCMEKIDAMEGTFICFDLETTGFGFDAEITQVSARYEDSYFNQYVVPNKPIVEGASKATGLVCENNVLYKDGKVVKSATNILTCLLMFGSWLKKFTNPILVAHNALSLDAPVLVNSILKYDPEGFRRPVIGFVDTLPLFKSFLPGRDSYKLGSLVADTGFKFSAHDASEDALALQQLIKYHKISHEKLFDHSFTIEYAVGLRNYQKEKARRSQPFKVLVKKKVISQSMSDKIVKEGLSYDALKRAYIQGGHDDLLDLLKPRVTKTERIIVSLSNYFSELFR